MHTLIANIHLTNIQHNAKLFREMTGTRLCAVVKANAYGHGAIEVVNALEGIADAFAVSILREAQEIYTVACGKDILVFTPPLDEAEICFASRFGFILSVTDYGVALLVDKTAKKYGIPVRVHLKINTGMNRYGMCVQSLGKACKLLADNPLVLVEGAYSHLFGDNLQSAKTQFEAFCQAKRVCQRYFSRLIYHLSATYGAMLGEPYTMDMVRIGLGLYGYLPHAEGVMDLRLKKAMDIYAPVTATRKCTGGGAGYGKPLPASRIGERMYTLRVGYADGFPRGADYGENPLCMDACVRFGNARKGQWIPVMTDAEERAIRSGTIAYEVLCSAMRRASKIYD